MAHMYPTPMRSDTESPAERLLYALFRDKLPDSYHVFHGVAWQARSGRHYQRDGEADFVIIHPEKGILVLEAKGGQISFDGPQGIWLQNGRDMGKDPFEQAKGSRYHLKRTLEEEGYWRQRNIAFGHAVAFPDVVSPTYSLTLQAHSTIILDKRALQNVADWMEAVFDYYRGQETHPNMDETGLKYLIGLLAPVRELRSLIGLDIQDEAAEFVRLTENQFKLLDHLAATPRAAIAGCAGSGKTMLAAEKARRLAAQGWRVLLTCFNGNLATFLREEYLAVRPQTLHIDHFHKVASSLIQRSGQKTPSGFKNASEKDYYFSEVVPDQLAEAASLLGPQYDAIVVDEAQDFKEQWWLPLQMLLENPDDGTFYIFHDDNQNLYGGRQQIENLAQAFPLSENLRNTQRINEVVAQFYTSDRPVEAQGPVGRPIEILPYTTEREMAEQLRQTLHRLVHEEEISPEDIVVLTPRSATKSFLSQTPKLGSFFLTRSWDTDYNQIYYETIFSFKGLESPVVILTEIAEEMHHKVVELLYVGCSRARSHLVVICQQEMVPWFSSVAKTLSQDRKGTP